MATINLRELYPVKNIANKKVNNPNCFIEVPDGEAEAFKADLTEEIADVDFNEQHAENALQRQRRRYNANYTLDCDEIEQDVINATLDPFNLCADKLERQQILDTIANLPEKQKKRIYAFYFMGMSVTEIAKKESVNKSQITRSIEKALANLKIILKNLI